MTAMIETDLATNLNALAALVHQNAIDKGFYDKPESRNQFIGRALMNIVGELGELWESHRRGERLCDKAAKMEAMGLPALTCVEEELADILIRCLDTAAAMDVDIGRAVLAKHAYNKTREYRHGGKVA